MKDETIYFPIFSINPLTAALSVSVGAAASALLA
jgi:hypothetical protein